VLITILNMMLVKVKISLDMVKSTTLFLY